MRSPPPSIDTTSLERRHACYGEELLPVMLQLAYEAASLSQVDQGGILGSKLAVRNVKGNVPARASGYGDTCFQCDIDLDTASELLDDADQGCAAESRTFLS